MPEIKVYHLHLVSDATGETLESVAKASLAQFEDVEVVKHFWPMVRTPKQMTRIVDDIAAKPGLVMYTLVNKDIRDELERCCAHYELPTLSVLNPVIQSMAAFLGRIPRGLPGQQHLMDAAYFRRIDAMQYTLAHDDGQAVEGLADADIILVGVSRTSKTPTAMYLANRGYKTANIPIVPGVPLPEQLFALEERVLVVALTNSPDRLVQVRKNRLLSLAEQRSTDYIDPERVKEEVQYARRLAGDRCWPVIDVTRRSIEETAAAVLNLYQQRHEDEIRDE